jgi:predicted MFS family arabinose efflux permease
MYAVEGLVEFISANIIVRYGPKHAITASIPFVLFYLYLLQSLGQHTWPIWFLGVIGGISLGLYWQAYHYDFSKAKKTKSVTKELSSLYIVLSMLGAIAPFAGGVIAERLGMPSLLIISMILLSFGVVALFKTGDRTKPNRKINFKAIDVKCVWRDWVAYGGLGWDAKISLTVWPVFIYLIVKDYQSVGIVTSLALIITVFVTWWVGRNADNKNREQFIKVGGVASAFVYFAQTLVSNIFHIFGINLVKSLTHSIMLSPIVSEYYLHADEESRSEYVMSMELATDIFGVIILGTLLLLLLFLPQKTVLVVGLVMAGFGMLFSGLMRPAKCEIQNKQIKVMPRPSKK